MTMLAPLQTPRDQETVRSWLEEPAPGRDPQDGPRRNWVLRREGGNAFQDPALDGLVGHRIRGTGEKTGYTLILRDWEDLGE